MSLAIRDRLLKREPMLGAAVGSGMTAAAAVAGGVDFLMILNAGHFRSLGCSSSAALMPYANANQLTLELAERYVLPRVAGVPCFLGVCAQDPEADLAGLFENAKRLGLAGLTNFPSVGFIDGQFREALEESGLGYEREVKLLNDARKAGFVTAAFCFDTDTLQRMADVGADLLGLDLGFAYREEQTQGMDEEGRAEALDQAITRIREALSPWYRSAKPPYVAVLGGAIVLPQDVARIRQQTSTLGYIGGSSIERYPARPAICQVVREFRRALDEDEHTGRFGGLIGRSPAMADVFAQIPRIAASDAPVLLVGESGTGKELAAREIHRHSRRAARPMVCWNCGATTESLAMSELFGHKRGAFTGAVASRKGKFELADGATLFMDEVTDLPLGVQASLLRVLQEREVLRVGEERAVPVDVRLIAASNRDFSPLLQSSAFRLDLYYRLNTVVLRLPPLRERKEDIPLLFAEFCHEFGQRYGVPTPEASSVFQDALSRHDWPGNIRELRNCVERCFILGRGQTFRVEWIEGPDTPQAGPRSEPATGQQDVVPAARTPTKSGPSLRALRARLSEAIVEADGNKAAAARALGISRKTLYAWLREQARDE